MFARGRGCFVQQPHGDVALAVDPLWADGAFWIGRFAGGFSNIESISGAETSGGKLYNVEENAALRIVRLPPEMGAVLGTVDSSSNVNGQFGVLTTAVTPDADDVYQGAYKVVRNEDDDSVKLYANIGGSLVSITLT
jgi:hypothetical protein